MSDRKIQLRYTIENIVFIAIVLSVVTIDLVILQRAGNSFAIDSSGPSSALYLIYLIFRSEWMVLVPMYLLTFALVYFIPIYYSHRFIGPVQKTTSTLKTMSKGVLVNDIKFRKNDYFKELEQALNETTTAYRQTFADLKNATDNIKHKAESLGNSELSADVEALELILNKYQEEEKKQNHTSESEGFETHAVNT